MAITLARFSIAAALLAHLLSAQAELLVFSYHNADGGTHVELGTDAMAVTNTELANQFSWLKAHGYQVIDLDQVLAAREGRAPLPDKSVLLVFDDGYAGLYQHVFPLLKLFNYPAVAALVGSWLEVPEEGMVPYGKRPMPRRNFLTWLQIREMVDSGLVEVASHSYDLHHGIQANPQGNEQPAATTLRYDPETATYEDAESYRARIRADLARSIEVIEKNAGQRPRAVVWPYGAYNRITIDIANGLGMPIAMSLDSGITDINRLDNVRRVLIGKRTDISHFVWLITDHAKPTPHPERVVHVDLDYVYDSDSAQQDKNLSQLLDRIKAMGISTVYLQAFADPDGDGNADSLYFPNRHLPMRADLFNRVAWQLKTRADVKVYAWLPVLAYDLPDAHPLNKARVRASPPRDPATIDYRRLSPFNKEALRFVGDIYEDLAKYAAFAGLIFHDDAYLNDYEDASSWALEVYAREWGLPANIDVIRNDEALLKQWTKRKSEALAQWTDALTDRVRIYRPTIKTARNLYASVIMNPDAETWFAQSLEVFLKHYDYTAVMAMPYMEKAKNPEQWLGDLVERVAAIPGALNKTVFELQSVNWRTKQPVDSSTLARQMNILLQHGAANFGYYPDDFIQGHPRLDVIRTVFSLTTIPKE